MPLIVIEGLDSSGKATQVEKLYLRLLFEGQKVKRISFPNYNSESSTLVKMYLNGSFGETASDVSPYAASSFYAVDRYASYMTNWKRLLDAGQFVISDRYVASNLIHQAAKFETNEEKDAYIEWETDYEHNKLGLPKADFVLFLNMPPELSIKLMEQRANKFTGHMEKDIHEKDAAYIQQSYQNAKYIIQKNPDWKVISCADANGNLRSIEDINEEIYALVKEKFGL